MHEEARRKKPAPKSGLSCPGRVSCRGCYAGDHLISHTLTRAVPSAQRGLTSVFGMGTGGTLAVWSPANSSDAWRGWFPRGRVSSGQFLQGRNAADWRHSLANPRDLTRGQARGPKRNRLEVQRPVECLCNELRRVNSMIKPNGRLVLVSCTHYCAFTSSLSTRWSSWALQGDLILGRASRLYAFSGYHNRTSLPSRAIGMTTGTQEVRPSRSSRTKDSPPQISYAHSR